MPEIWIAWRRDIPDLARAGAEAADAALSFFRPRPAELARVPVTAAKKLLERAILRREEKGLALVVVRGDGGVHAAVVRDAVELPSLAYPDTGASLPTASAPRSSSSGERPDSALSLRARVVGVCTATGPLP